MTLGLVDRETDVLVAVTALGLVGALTVLLVLHPAVPGPDLVVLGLGSRQGQAEGEETGDDNYLCWVTTTHTAALAVYVCLEKCKVLMATEAFCPAPSYIVQRYPASQIPELSGLIGTNTLNIRIGSRTQFL